MYSSHSGKNNKVKRFISLMMNWLQPLPSHKQSVHPVLDIVLNYNGDKLTGSDFQRLTIDISFQAFETTTPDHEHNWTPYWLRNLVLDQFVLIKLLTLTY